MPPPFILRRYITPYFIFADAIYAYIINTTTAMLQRRHAALLRHYFSPCRHAADAPPLIAANGTLDS